MNEGVEAAIERLFDEIAPLAELRGYRRQRIMEDVRQIIAGLGREDDDFDDFWPEE